MSSKYKFYNNAGVYFISFATINWIDVFIREIYMNVVVESLKYCQKEKGLNIFAWVIMPSHIHLIFSADKDNPSEIIRDFKKFTSKKLQKHIYENVLESRKEWILWMMERAGTKNSNIKFRQFWQQRNHPIELWSKDVIEQKLDYLHKNPVESGFVSEIEHWKYSSAIDYCGGKGLIDIIFIN